MNEEIKHLNEVKDKYDLHFVKSDLLVDELYEEMKNFEFINLLIDYPKIERKNLIISDYFDDNPKNLKNDENQSESDLVKDIICDYIEIKQLIKSK